MLGRFETAQLRRFLPGSHTTVLLAFTATMLLWQLGSARTFTGHECYVAQGAREMLATGDWLVPRVGGRPWLEKPPLAHWVVAASGAILGGVNEFSARLPSVLCGLCGVVLLARLAGRQYGPNVGLLVGLAQSVSVYFLTYARLAEADIYLWLMVIGCLTIFAGHWVDPAAPRRWYSGRVAFFVLLGLTQLAKGPMFGAVMALLPCMAFLLSQPRWTSVKWLLHWPGLVLFGILAVAWPAAILAAGHQDALDLWWLHTFGRLSEETAINPKPLWYYFTTLPWQVLPWTIAMLPAMPESFRRAWREPRSFDRLLWLWLLVPLAALTVVNAKHHHYLIYALPPCSFWGALGLLKWRAMAANLWARRRVNFALVTLSLAALVAGWAIARSSNVKYANEVLLLGGLVVGASVLIHWSCFQKKYRLAGAAFFGTLWMLSGYTHGVLMPRMDHYREDTLLLERLNERTAGKSPVVIIGLEPSRMLLHLDGPYTICDTAAQVKAACEEHPDALVLTCSAYEEPLHEIGEPNRIDRTPQPRRKNVYDSWLAVYQIDAQPPVGPDRDGELLQAQLPDDVKRR